MLHDAKLTIAEEAVVLPGPTFRREVLTSLTIAGTRGSSLGERAVRNRSFGSELKSGQPPLPADVLKVRAPMRKTANDEQRVAITDDRQEERDLSPDPTAIEALVEDPRQRTTGSHLPQTVSEGVSHRGASLPFSARTRRHAGGLPIPGIQVRRATPAIGGLSEQLRSNPCCLRSLEYVPA